MWWLAIPVVILIGKAIHIAVSNENFSVSVEEKTILEKNLDRLSLELDNHSNRFAIMGQPGAGKSSLLNKMTDNLVVPPPQIGTTTDATNWAEGTSCHLLSKYEDVTFIDVPGYDTSLHPVDKFIHNFPFHKIDHYFFVTNGKLHNADEVIFERIKRCSKNVTLIRTFSESLDETDRQIFSNNFKERLSLSSSDKVLFVSNRTNEGISMMKTKILVRNI
jgi:predicted GTPase